MKAFFGSLRTVELRLSFAYIACLVTFTGNSLLSSAAAQAIPGADAQEQEFADFATVSDFSELADDPEFDAEVKQCDAMRVLQLAYPYIQFVSDMLGKKPPVYNPLTTEVVIDSLPASAAELACVQELVPQLNKKLIAGKVVYSVSFTVESKTAFLKCLEEGKQSTSSDFANLADAERTIPDLDPLKATDPLYKLFLAYNAQGKILIEHGLCLEKAARKSLERQKMKNE